MVSASATPRRLWARRAPAVGGSRCPGGAELCDTNDVLTNVQMRAKIVLPVNAVMTFLLFKWRRHPQGNLLLGAAPNPRSLSAACRDDDSHRHTAGHDEACNGCPTSASRPPSSDVDRQNAARWQKRSGRREAGGLARWAIRLCAMRARQDTRSSGRRRVGPALRSAEQVAAQRAPRP